LPERPLAHFLDKQRNAAGALIDPLDHLFGERVARRDFADHAFNGGTTQGGQRNQAVVRAQAPGRAELGTGRRKEQQWRLRTAVGKGAQQVE